MKKSKASAIDSQLKSSLKQLKKLGLYNPKNPRAAPSKYAKGLVKQFTMMGVLGEKPKAAAIKIPASYAKQIGTEYKTKRAKGGAIAIVPKRTNTRTFYSKKEGAIVQKMGGYSFRRYSDSLVLIRGDWPKLERGERLAIPKGNGWKILKDRDAVNKEMMKYDPFDRDVNFWQYPYIVTRN